MANLVGLKQLAAVTKDQDGLPLGLNIKKSAHASTIPTEE